MEWADAWLILLGAGVGVLGTLIGAGGGFILMPVLLLLYPNAGSETLTSISLAVVFMNASSGTMAYARMRRVDYKSGIIFAIATVPGAIIGASTTKYLPRETFDPIFGSLLLLLSAYLIYRTSRNIVKYHPSGKGFHRKLTDADGHVYEYRYNLPAGIMISVGVGYLSSLLGIGGGIIHVPVMVNLLHFPVHIATATSHFALAIMALAGTIEHLISGTLKDFLFEALLIGVGAVAGAQLGARLSKKVNGKWIIISLAIALGSVGLRIIIGSLL